MAFNFKKLEIPDVVLVEPKVFSDERGFFMETYRRAEFRQAGIDADFIQDNHVKSGRPGILRGMHYQVKPKAQAKLVRAVKGGVFDVAVDLREGSPTFGRWVAVTLTAENKRMLYIPEGFAHGYCTLDPDTEIVYKCSDIYSPECERGLLWNDPAVGIAWPIKNPVLSDRDAKFPTLSQARDKGLING